MIMTPVHIGRVNVYCTFTLNSFIIAHEHWLGWGMGVNRSHYPQEWTEMNRNGIGKDRNGASVIL